jgi:hypothetical protein
MGGNTMENLNVSIILIVLVGIHITEETVKDFRSFFNMEWFNGSKDCPVGRIKGLFVDKIGLFLLLTVLALMGHWLDTRWILIAVGIITADFIQHTLFSFVKRGYTPGVATSVFYLLYIVYLFVQEERSLGGLDWVALLGGAAFIGGNYFTAWLKVRKGKCAPVVTEPAV